MGFPRWALPPSPCPGCQRKSSSPALQLPIVLPAAKAIFLKHMSSQHAISSLKVPLRASVALQNLLSPAHTCKLPSTIKQVNQAESFRSGLVILSQLQLVLSSSLHTFCIPIPCPAYYPYLTINSWTKLLTDTSYELYTGIHFLKITPPYLMVIKGT